MTLRQKMKWRKFLSRLHTISHRTTALMRLRNQAFHARMYRGMDAEAQLFMQAAALARTVPLHALIVPDGIKAMAESLKEVDLMQPESMQQRREATEEDASND
jgi:hypothetical protein